MGFFKKLKERLFSFNIDDQEKNKVKVKKNKDFNKDEQSEKKIIENTKKLKKSKLKLEKKIAKEKKYRDKKNQKINKYVAGLSKTSDFLINRIKEIKSKNHYINESFFEDLEEMLIMTDISMNLVTEIVDEVKKEVKNQKINDINMIFEILVDKIFLIYTNNLIVDTRLKLPEERTNVILVSGVNGSGKTTSIAKLAYHLKKENKKVLIVAGDTFRAGAVEQLDIWAKRLEVDIIKPIKNGADPASVVYKALEAAEDSHYDVLIIDTAGRLQNKINLMQELAKMKKIITRKIPNAPHESLLVIDSTTGQNGVLQAQKFKEFTNLTGLILTKMDGTSKGGIILTIKDILNIPVKFVGFGEGLEDLKEFDIDAFIYGMTKSLIDESKI